MTAQSYVRSAEDIRAMEASFSKTKWLYEGLRVEFETTTEFLKDILPPGLEADDQPQGLVSLGRWQSANVGEFDTGSVFVRVRHGQTSGWYNLTMLVSGEMPVVWGREVWGEVKKHGRIGIHRDGNSYYAWAERNGERLIELEGEMTREDFDVESVSVAMEVKAYPAASGIGLEWDPLLITLENKATWRKIHSGSGKLVLRSGVNDPLGSIPIVKVTGASFAEGVSDYRHISTERLCGAEEYLPYLYGRHYDDFLQFRVANRFR